MCCFCLKKIFSLKEMKFLEFAVLLAIVKCSVGLVLIHSPHGAVSCLLSGHHLCKATGVCIQSGWLCDGDDDCGDHSDEDPLICKPESCSSTTVGCKDTGRCIPATWVCDGEADCSDRSDEPANCSSSGEDVPCPAGRFKCAPRQCIPMSWVCDGVADCLSGLDEVGCRNHSCRSDEFMCPDRRCIDKSFVCDGEDDCGDDADENNCPACASGYFECADHGCILSKWKCDGESDCEDGSDERNCSSTSQHRSLCNIHEFQCPGDLLCIQSSWVCNGRKECPDGADESPTRCANITCRLDEFKCKNNKCISGNLQCNGYNDCSDDSDEEDCGTQPPACAKNEFDCGDRNCIPLSKACDGHADCPGGEDEPRSKCGVNECQTDNGGCSQLCLDTPTSYRCECRPGFRLADNVTCDDIDECDDPSSCSQLCINLKGSFKCECLEGYMKDLNNHRSCKATQYNATLIATKRHDIREISLHNPEMRVLINDTKSAIALDIDISSSLIFWSDGLDKSIYRANISKGNLPVRIIAEDTTPCDGLAVDWIYKHIYWTDTQKDTISVANFDGKMQKTLVKDDLDKPRAIAVDPINGWMFWSDWGRKPKIERSGMDASHRSPIVFRGIEWPNGITLDLVKRRLYWVDARLDTISSVNFDGTKRRTLLKSSPAVVHPFSIAVFEDYMYWTDWVNHGLFRANKFDGSKATKIMGNLSSLMVVHVNHPYKQPKGVNYCLKTQCSHLCLPAPQINPQSPKISCACPDDAKCTTPSEGPVTPSVVTPHAKVTKTPQPEQKAKIASKPPSKTSPQPSWFHNNTSFLVKDHNDSKSEPFKVLVTLAGILLLIAALGTFLYFGYQRYQRLPRGSLAFVNPIYHRANDDQVTLTKEDYNQTDDRPQGNPNNYENFL